MLIEKLGSIKARVDRLNATQLGLEEDSLRELLSDYGQSAEQIAENLLRFMFCMDKITGVQPQLRIEASSEIELLDKLLATAESSYRFYDGSTPDGKMWENVYTALQALV